MSDAWNMITVQCTTLRRNGTPDPGQSEIFFTKTALTTDKTCQAKPRDKISDNLSVKNSRKPVSNAMHYQSPGGDWTYPSKQITFVLFKLKFRCSCFKAKT